ncbi:hypothetical protein C8R43DRAFT_625538 [Mycena crocata]|nr:hypothetical protein C8R43DRAFT_625538 [Mycena crocata]
MYSLVVILLLALASVEAKSISCPSSRNEPESETGCTNQTFFSPANSDLPEGTYIAASLAGALKLADYLDTHPGLNVRNLLISDSTVQDLATDFGYGETDYYYTHRPNDQPEVDHVPLNRNISTKLKQTIVDLDAVSSRIMDRVAPSLESLSYLNYIRIWDTRRYEEAPDNRTRNVLDREFPRLSHLTLRDWQWRFQTLPGKPARFFRSLPSVTHLHVTSGSFPSLSALRKSVPNATHIRLSGNLPSEFSASPMFVVQWTRSLIDGFSGIAKSPIIIAQPNFSPMLQRGRKCGNPGIEYTCLLSRLARNRHLLLSLPDRDDYDKYGVTYLPSRLFPLSRGIAEFEDRIMGGEGEWELPSNNDTMRSKGSLQYCN